MAFTEQELEYLRSQPLGRIATVGPDDQPDNAAVGFRALDDGTILVGGMNVTRTRKWRNVEAGNDRVAFVVDDLASTRPWRSARRSSTPRTSTATASRRSSSGERSAVVVTRS